LTENVFKRISGNSNPNLNSNSNLNLNPKTQKRLWKNKLRHFSGKRPDTVFAPLPVCYQQG